MAKEYSALSTQPLTSCNSIISNDHLPEIVHLDDAASDVMIDFKVLTPTTIGPERAMSQARKVMEDSNNPICLVTDDNDCVLGLIALQDILGSKPVKLLQETRLERKQLKVKHLMINIEELEAIDYSALEIAHVGHVISTLHKLQQHYILVSENQNEKQVLRGIFIDSQISKQLGVNIRSSSQHLSVAELQHKLLN